MSKIAAICISRQRGTLKEPVQKAQIIEDWGIEGDAHAGKWHRQISLLGLGQIEEFRRRGADIDYGAFGENLVVDDMHMSTLPVGTRLRIGGRLGAELEITQIGKQCHSHCAIYQTVGDCIMPREGVFASVIKGGQVKVGDSIEIIADNSSGSDA